MIGLFIILGSIVPIFLAFALLTLKQPRWLGWALWAVSVAVAIYAWAWWLGIIPSDGSKTYGVLFALWFSWAPIAALFIKTKKGKV